MEVQQSHLGQAVEAAEEVHQSMALAVVVERQQKAVVEAVEHQKKGEEEAAVLQMKEAA